MKTIKNIIIYFFIFLFFQTKQIHKSNERQLWVIEGIVGAFALGGVVLYKYIQDPIKTFENDENWEERFLNYVQEETLIPIEENINQKTDEEKRRASITFKFINLIKDNFGSDLTNDCIKTIKQGYNDRIKSINQQLNMTNPNKYKNPWDISQFEKKNLILEIKGNKNQMKLIKSLIKQYKEIEIEENQLYSICFDYYHYVQSHFHMSKHFLEKSLEDQKDEQDQFLLTSTQYNKFFNLMEDFYIKRENKENNFYKSYFYTIENYFLKNNGLIREKTALERLESFNKQF